MGRFALVCWCSLFWFAAAAPANFRAAWISATYDVQTKAALCTQLKSLKAVGIDRVYIDVWVY